MSDLMVVDDVRDTRLALASVDVLTNLANRYMAFPPHGKKLQMQEAAALAATAWMLDADPANDELYVTNTGIQKGIMLYRRKARAYAESKGSAYSVRFRKPEEGEIQYDPAAGDLAIVCELIDREEHVAWERRWSEAFNMLYEASKDHKYADNRATRLAGPEPIHIGYGVVDHREKFSKDEYAPDEKGRSVLTGKTAPEMMAREQRRNKRAEKAALKSAYPDLMAKLDSTAPEFDLGKVVDVVIKEVELKQLEPPRHKQEGYNVKQELIDLGVDVPDDTYDIAPDSPEITGVDLPEVTYTPQAAPTPYPLEGCKFGVDVVEDIVAANINGVKDIGKITEALNRSQWLSPAMEAKWYRMWVSFYVDARKAGKDKDAAAGQADNNVANCYGGE